MSNTKKCGQFFTSKKGFEAKVNDTLIITRNKFLNVLKKSGIKISGFFFVKIFVFYLYKYVKHLNIKIMTQIRFEKKSINIEQEIQRYVKLLNYTKMKKQDMNKQKQSNELGVVFIVTDSSNYYQEPVTVRIFSTKEKAISFCDKKDPNRKYLDWEEFEVE